MGLARKEYVEPDNAVTRQTISQRNQMHSFLKTVGPFIPILPRKRPITTQHNRITEREQHAASVHIFGPPVKRARVTPPVTTTNNLQLETMFAAQ